MRFSEIISSKVVKEIGASPISDGQMKLTLTFDNDKEEYYVVGADTFNEFISKSGVNDAILSAILKILKNQPDPRIYQQISEVLSKNVETLRANSQILEKVLQQTDRSGPR